MNSDAPPPPAPPKPRGCLRKLLWTGLTAILLLAAVVFLARRQIGDALARNLDQRLADAGIYIKWDSATWIPGPGIRLDDVEVFRDAEKTDRLVLLSNVAAIKAEPGWDRWDTFKVEARKGKLVLDHGKNETALKNIHLDLVIEPGKAVLEQFRAGLLGWQVEANGNYLMPSEPAPPDAPPTDVPREKASPLGDIDLDWLVTVKEWAQVAPQKAAPTLKIEFESVPDSGGVNLALNMGGKEFRWRDQQWDSIDVSVKGSFGGGPVPITIEGIEIGHGGKKARLAGSVDLANHAVHVSEFESSVDPLALARAFSADAAKSLEAVSSEGAWHISGAGSIRTDQPMASNWKGDVSLSGGLTYAQEKTKVTLESPGLSLHLAKEVLTIGQFKAGLWGGGLSIPETTFALGNEASQPSFQTGVKLSNASMQAMSHSFGSGANQPGVVNADWTGGGGFDLPSIKGAGTASIHQAEFFRIPLLGPLHLVFDQLTPGFGRDVASDLTANHSLDNGVLSIRNLSLESKLTRIEGNGDVNLQKEHAHFTAKAKLQGIVGLATAILSALLEVEGEGPVSDMKWKLKNLAGGELIKGAAGVVGKTGGAVIEGGGAVIKGAGGAATGTAKEAGKAVKGILKLPGRLIPGGKKE